MFDKFKHIKQKKKNISHNDINKFYPFGTSREAFLYIRVKYKCFVQHFLNGVGKIAPTQTL